MGDLARTRVARLLNRQLGLQADSAVERPVPWLFASNPVWAEAGESVAGVLNVPTRLPAYWDNWYYADGEYRLRVGSSVTDLPSATAVLLAT